MNLPETAKLQEIYGETEKSSARFQKLADNFAKTYKHDKAEYFTSAGRTEIIGNHTDHNGGKVIAGSINLDAIGAAYPNGTQTIHITSEGYRDEIVVDLTKLSKANYKKGTPALVAGMMEGAQKNGFKTAGFDAYVSTNVIAAAGVSSSASFEMLICTIIDYFFNESKMTYNDYAKVGQYAENVYWDKASGMMDQMACAVGGLITIDFVEPMTPVVQKIDFDFKAQNHSLIIVQTGKGHADLSAEYSSIPEEMKKVAKYFGKDVLAQISEEKVIQHLPEIRKFAGDRAVLRALHFFEENKRVEAEVAALKEGRFNDFLENITASGNSSWKWLQNCFTTSNNAEQGITVALALTELFIAQKQRGACRVHGGGFAGVIMAMLPNDLVEEYTKYMEKCLGEGCAYNMSIRPYGAICVSDYL